MTDSCSVCEAELASVTLVTPEGKVRLGVKCARILEALARPAGIRDVRRRPALQVLE